MNLILLILGLILIVLNPFPIIIKIIGILVLNFLIFLELIGI